MSAASAEVEFDRLTSRRLNEAAAMAARAMAPDPMSIAIFAAPETRTKHLETMFRLTLASLKRPALIATVDGVIVGIVAYAHPGECFFRQMINRRKVARIRGQEIGFAIPSVPIRLLPRLIRVGAQSMKRMSAWTEVVAGHDPVERHHHIELVAVDPPYQGQGIGRLMMERVLGEMNDSDAITYLETDTDADERFYRRLGFDVADTAEVLDVAVRFMTRPATAKQAAAPPDDV